MLYEGPSDARHRSDTQLTVSSLNPIYFGDTAYNLLSYPIVIVSQIA
jgi:hypothetical protein